MEMEGIVNSLGVLSAAIIDKIGTDLPGDDKSIWEVYGFVLAYMKENNLIGDIVASEAMVALSREYLWMRRKKCLRWVTSSYNFYKKQFYVGFVLRDVVTYNLKHPSADRLGHKEVLKLNLSASRYYKEWMEIEDVFKSFGIEAE